MEQWNKPEINSANVFNVSSGKDIEILELAKCYNTKISFMPKRKGEAINNLASNEKLSKLTGWKPFVNIREWIKFYENTL
jgi:nucleoside-diphosphate-sugar epimerase